MTAALTRGFLDELKLLVADPVVGSAASELLSLWVSKVTGYVKPPLRAYISGGTPSLVVSVDPISFTTTSSQNKSLAHIGTSIPAFTGGTVTVPSASGGSITFTPSGTAVTLTLSSGNYINMLIYITSAGTLGAVLGAQGGSTSGLPVPATPAGAYGIAYVTLQNVGGTIQNLTDSSITHLVGGGYGIALLAAQNKGMQLIGGGNWSWTLSTSTLAWSANANVAIPGLADSANLISSGSITVADGAVVYATLNRLGSGGTISLSSASSAGVPVTENTFVIARRSGSVIHLVGAISLVDGESRALYSGISNQNQTLLGLTSEGQSSPAWNTTLSAPLRTVPSDSTPVLTAVANIDAQIDKFFGQLRLTPKIGDPTRVKLSAADVTMLDAVVRTQVLNSFVLNFAGAEIDLDSSNVYASDGTTLLSTWSQVTPAVGMYRWLSITLLSGSVGSDNRIGATISILAGSADGASASAAPRALYVSGGLPIGQVCILNTAGAISLNTISQLGSGSGGGSGGTGDTTDLRETLKIHGTTSGMYELLAASVFAVDGSTWVDGTSTGGYSYIDKAYDLPTIGNMLVSTNLLDPDEFIADGLVVGQIDVVVMWHPGKIDASATYWASRHGGSAGTWEQITVSRVGNLTDTFQGRLIFSGANSDTSDLRLKVVSATTGVAIDAFGVYYRNIDAGMQISGRKNFEVQSFNSNTDKLGSGACVFTLTRFIPDPDMLLVVVDGQCFQYGDFTLNGYAVTFPDNFFQTPDSKTMFIKFLHVGAGSFDNSDSNAALLAAAHIGSTNANLDRSIAGRGIQLRRPDGVLVELTIDNSNNVSILDT